MTSIALVSDAGTPLISDPGFKLVREAQAAGCAVTAIPGASAVLAALAVAGLPTDRFFFEGFLPAKEGQRRARIAELGRIPATLVLFETGPRIADALADLSEGLGPREAAVCRELTKLHEEVRRGDLAALARDYAQGAEPRGEIVIVIAPPGQDEPSAPPISTRCCATRSTAFRSRKRSPRSPPSPAIRAARSISARSRSPKRARRSAPMATDRPRATPVAGRGPSVERQVAFRTGISAESRAAALLIAKGFRILARRWRSPAGEIDIVARRRGLLVFVEVKARERLDDAAWSVTGRQRARIVAAAEAWLATYPDDRIRDIRFDAMLVAPGRIPQHIPAAFDASG